MELKWVLARLDWFAARGCTRRSVHFPRACQRWGSAIPTRRMASFAECGIGTTWPICARLDARAVAERGALRPRRDATGAAHRPRRAGCPKLHGPRAREMDPDCRASRALSLMLRDRPLQWSAPWPGRCRSLAEAAALGRSVAFAWVIGPEELGRAMMLALTVRLIEMASDAGIDRLMVQARDGHSRALQAALHGREW
jgi:hypothetical protein